VSTGLWSTLSYMGTLAGPLVAGSTSGSVALSLCTTTTHPLHTRFTKIVGTSISEAMMRPNPRSTAQLAGVGVASQLVALARGDPFILHCHWLPLALIA
jgi:hypothetical protein